MLRFVIRTTSCGRLNIIWISKILLHTRKKAEFLGFHVNPNLIPNLGALNKKELLYLLSWHKLNDFLKPERQRRKSSSSSLDVDLRCKEKIHSDVDTDLESENEVFEQNKFVLGPTPAQQKRSTGMSPDEMDKILETVNFRQKFSSLPEFKPGDSPTVVASSPKVFIQSYTRYVGF